MKKKEKERGRLWCFTFDFPFRLIGAPQLVRSVTCRSFTDKQGRHGSITHSYNLSLSLRPAAWWWRDNMSIFDKNNFICLMVFLDRPIYRSRRDGRSKKRPGATLGLDVPWLTTPQIMHTHSRELCTRHAGIEPGQIWHTLPTFARVTFSWCSRVLTVNLKR